MKPFDLRKGHSMVYAITIHHLTSAASRWLAAVFLLLLLPLHAHAIGDGLNASYYDNYRSNQPFPSGAPDLARVDATVDFNWGTGSPGTGIGSDRFGVRWQGQVEAPESGNYIFSTQSDDGVRLWINGNLVINNWTDHGPTWNNSASINLQAGMRYDVRMEFYENGGGAVARLHWQTPSNPTRRAIPQAQLYSSSAPTLVSVAQPCGVFNQLVVAFSRDMQAGNGATSAERRQNYSITGASPPGINVSSAVLSTDQRTVTLDLNKDLEIGVNYTIQVQNVQSTDGLTIAPNPSSLSLTAAAGSPGNGVSASYWNFDVVSNGYAFPGGTPTLTRVDPEIDFDWGSSSPQPGIINTERFAARWEAQVEAPESGNYIFSTQSDDGVRLWLNGMLVVDNWTLHGPTWNDSATISLTAGQRYDLRMEYFERTGGAVARLYWRTPSDIAGGLSRHVIANSQLYSCIPPTAPELVSVTMPCGVLNQITAVYSKDMKSGNQPGSAARRQHYTLLGAPPGVNIQSASLAADNRTVTLALSGNLVAGSSYTLQASDVVDTESPPLTISPNPTSLPFVAGNNGLMGSYWNYNVEGNGRIFPSSLPTMIRTDPVVDFSWGSGSPSAGTIDTDRFAVRWEGYVEAPENGNYTFWTRSDDGVRLWVNGNQIINNWTLHSATWSSSAAIPLQAGQRYAIRMEFYENTGQAEARLHWQTPSNGTRRAIPSSQLFSCATPSGPHHIRLTHDGSALTCEPETVLIQACATADCSSLHATPIDVTLAPTGWVGGDTITVTGQALVQLRHTSVSTVTLNVTNTTPTAANPLECYVSGSIGSCNLTFHDTGFAFDVPTLAACATSPAVTIRAVRKDDTTERCVPAFANRSETINFWSTYSNPNSGNRTVRINGTAIATTTPGTGITLVFDANGESSFNAAYNDAGQMQLDARFDGSGTEAGLIMTGSDLFVSTPAKLLIYSDDTNNACASANPLDAACTAFTPAGAPFNLKVRAACGDDSVTPNFQHNAIGLSHTLIAPAAGVTGTISANNFDMLAADNGEHVVAQSVSEVGVFTFTAKPPAGGYFGETVPAGTSANIGRFIPARFVVSANTPVFDHGCALGPNPFTYVGQQPITGGFGFTTPPVFIVTPQNLAGGFTQNYAQTFWRLNDALAGRSYTNTAATAAVLSREVSGGAATRAGDDFDAVAPTLTINGDRFMYSRPANPEAPFNALADLSLSPADITDADGICYDAANPRCITTLGDTPQSFTVNGITGTQMRYGVGFAQDTYGTSGQPGSILTMPTGARYYNGPAGWPINGDDLCSSYSYTQVDTGITTTITPVSPATLTSGLGNLTLQATTDPGTPGGSTRVSFTWPAWLPGPASATATFGIYRGDDRFLFWREP